MVFKLFPFVYLAALKSVYLATLKIFVNSIMIENKMDKIWLFLSDKK